MQLFPLFCRIVVLFWNGFIWEYNTAIMKDMSWRYHSGQMHMVQNMGMKLQKGGILIGYITQVNYDTYMYCNEM